MSSIRTSSWHELSWSPSSSATGHALRGRAQLLPVEQCRGAVLVVHGYGDHAGRYDEVADALLTQGLAVLRYDAWGHGSSPGQRGYVRRFEDYVNDLAAAFGAARALVRGVPLSVLGHSNGGLVALRAVQSSQLPGLHRLVLSSPLLRLASQQRKVPDWLARVLSVVVPRLPIPSGIRPGQLTRDAEWQSRTATDPLCNRVATPRWYWTATVAGRAALDQTDRVRVPCLVVRATHDELVDSAAVEEFFERLTRAQDGGGLDVVTQAGSVSRCIVVEGGRHEVLNELGRVDLLRQISRFVLEAV